MDRYIYYLDDNLLDDIPTAVETFHEYAIEYNIIFTGKFADDRNILIDFWRNNPEILLIEYQTQFFM